MSTNSCVLVWEAQGVYRLKKTRGGELYQFDMVAELLEVSLQFNTIFQSPTHMVLVDISISWNMAWL